MTSYDNIVSVTLWRGQIIAITDDGTIWRWHKHPHVGWVWERQSQLYNYGVQ